jgi:hypothetical protein
MAQRYTGWLGLMISSGEPGSLDSSLSQWNEFCLPTQSYIRSKSSNLSRYFRMLRLILELSTQVTKSSRFLYHISIVLYCQATTAHLGTRNAGSVTTSTPTRTCCCSISLAACSRLWAIPSLCITTGSLRLQNVDTVTLFCTSLNLPLPAPPVPKTPRSNSF